MIVKIKKSNLENKKMMAEFYEIFKVPGKMVIEKTKTIHFGQAGASDFTISKNLEQKQRYINRHEKNENWNNPMTAGSLSRWILWNKPTLKESIKDYKKKFNLS